MLPATLDVEAMLPTLEVPIYLAYVSQHVRGIHTEYVPEYLGPLDGHSRLTRVAIRRKMLRFLPLCGLVRIWKNIIVLKWCGLS